MLAKIFKLCKVGFYVGILFIRYLLNTFFNYFQFHAKILLYIIKSITYLQFIERSQLLSV